MLEQLKIVGLFYYNPRRAASEALDNGRLAFAIIAALVAAIALQSTSEVFRARQFSELTAPYSADGVEDVDTPNSSPSRFQPAGPLAELIVVLGLFVPAAIAVATLWQGSGRVMFTIQQQFGPLLLSTALAWTAARLPLLLLAASGRDPLHAAAGWFWIGSTVYFLALCAFCLRVALGAEWLPAGGAAVAGGLLVLIGGPLASHLSPSLYMLGSPCLLYYFWGRMSSGATFLGSSVSSKQSFRRAMEATTINPRDADAHYQLGLLQMHRRSWAEAESRFRTAAGIQPDDADYSFQLGCVLREQGREKEALEWLQRAAQLNDKAANNEVWREIGAAQLALANWSDSLAALECYVSRREYDPAGLVYCGEALIQNGRTAEARQMFERAIEAVRTMPGYRRGELRRWSSRAEAGLKRLRA